PHCDWDFTDSLRFTHCHPILRHASAPDLDWCQDLGQLVDSSRIAAWYRDDCGYDPQSLIRFHEADRVSDVVVLTGRCDSSRVAILVIRPGIPIQYRLAGAAGEDLLDLIAFALEDGVDDAPAGGSEARPSPSEFVDYDRAPEPIPYQQVEPVYPEFAKQAGIDGKVTLHVLVGKDGSVQDLEVIRGVPGLTEAAIFAVRQWGFRPAEAHGEPIAVWVEVPIDFFFMRGREGGIEATTSLHHQF
ncbi:MAG TPA: energy transducer TonB, partial [Candidatus Saccharimonadales bacterium]|nr:energy transducer TonB [Candidatus Saccharimonadales bacterium]